MFSRFLLESLLLSSQDPKAPTTNWLLWMTLLSDPSITDQTGGAASNQKISVRKLVFLHHDNPS